jgi:hypothetical protein
MTAYITIKSTESVKDFIFCLYKSGINLEITLDAEFYSLLHKAIQEKKVYPLWLKKDNLVEILNTMQNKYPELDYENDYLLSNELLKPTQEFSYICGKENLTSTGCISKEMAYEFILQQAKIIDDIIHLTEELQKLLKANSVSIDKYELILLIDNLFQSNTSQLID